MTSKTKKILSILASTLVLAGFTAGTVLNTEPTVSAAKHHKKKHTKKKRQTKKSTKHKQNANSNNDSSNNNNANNSTSNSTNGSNSSSDNTIEPQSKYSSLADWYAANGLKVYNRYRYDQNGTADSQEFSRGYSDGVFGVIDDTTQYNNELYKEGQILGTTFNDADPGAAVTSLPAQEGQTLSQLFQKSIDSYNAAGSYIQANPSVKYIQQTGTNQWGPNQ